MTYKLLINYRISNLCSMYFPLGKISHIANVDSGAADLEASIKQIIGNETSSNTEFEVEDGGSNQVKETLCFFK